MQALVDKLRADLSAFVDQRDDFILLVRASQADAAITLKILSDLEDENEHDLFLSFSGDFLDETSFVQAVVASLREQHQSASALQEAEGKPSLPPVPANLSIDEKNPPTAVLKRAIAFARSLLPWEGGHLLLWTLFPTQIHDLVAYRRFWVALTPKGAVDPWMRGVRLIIREDLVSSREEELRSLRRVRALSPDFGPKAMAEALAKEADDPSKPEPQQMQALLQLAMLDSAHGRTEAAISKYQILLDYFKKTENLTMQALILNGFGDIFQRAGDLEQAKQWYEFAVTPLVAAGQVASPVIFAMVIKNLGDIAFAQQRFGDAEQFYGGWVKLAGQTDPESRVRALELQGLSLEKIRAMDRATESFLAAVTDSRQYKMTPFLKQNLGHLRRVYETQGMPSEMNRVERELSNLESGGA